MGIYADEKFLTWFQKEFPKYAKKKLDMGKSCVRFTDIHDIPYDLIAKLVKKMSVKQRIALYEAQLRR
jgi:hypothetical protein